MLVTVLIILLIMTLAIAAFLVTAVDDAETGQLLLQRDELQRLQGSACELACYHFDAGRSEDLLAAATDELFAEQQVVWSHRRVLQDKVVQVPGLLDESAKLNINVLVDKRVGDVRQRERLLPIPGMTPALADAILDWIDEDDVPRPLGAEQEFYSSFEGAVPPRNRPVTDLADLLNVRGITPQLLYGTGGTPGWAHYLTVISAERIEPGRIDLNQSDLVHLYDQLEHEFGPAAAEFVAAYRLYGSIELAEELSQTGGLNREELPPVFEGDDNSVSENRMRGGLDLNAQSTFRIRSYFDLLGTTVRVRVGTNDQFLDSPWNADPVSCERNWRLLEEHCTVSTAPIIAGRINPLRAPAEVMMCLPEFPERLARQIESAQVMRPEEATLAWLHANGMCRIAELRRWGGYLTSEGSVFTGELSVSEQAVGRLQTSVEINAAPHPARYQRRELVRPLQARR